MAKKEDYLQGYGIGASNATEPPVFRTIDKTLNKAWGTNESQKKGIDQGYKEMENAKAAEKERSKKFGRTYNEHEISDGREIDYEVSKKKGYPSTTEGDLISANGEVLDEKALEGYKALHPEKFKKGGKVKAKKMASGGKVSSASKRADGCCVKGKTKGKYI